MHVRKAVQRYIQQRKASGTADSTIRKMRYQLKLFAEWCEGMDLVEVGDLRGFDIDDYYSIRADGIAPSTLENEMFTLQDFIEFLERREAVNDGLSDKVPIPNVEKEDQSSDEKLSTPDALALIRYFRNDSEAYGTRGHAFLELAWVTGARLGGLRGLDLRDVHVDEDYVEFHHRPETGTPLKNKTEGERPVALPPTTSSVIGWYLEHYRWDVHDDHGRAPFLSSRQGRPSTHTIRDWSYVSTQPCLHSPCPHDRERETCKFVTPKHSSKCPSSRSPHRIRTGSISWQLDLGLPPWVVSERANASVDVIEQHYDKTSPRERMERRRRPFIEELEIEDLNHE